MTRVTEQVQYQAYPGNEGQPQVLIVSGPAPRSNIILSWISCICFFPVGLVAVIKANDAARRWRQGDVDGARNSGEVAKWFAIAALVIGIIITLGVIAFLIFLFGYYIPSFS